MALGHATTPTGREMPEPPIDLAEFAGGARWEQTDEPNTGSESQVPEIVLHSNER
jgi:hypothetical protein